MYQRGIILSVIGSGRPTETIIRQLQRGQEWEENFRLLFERYYDQVYRFFRRKGLPSEDCRDLTQETFFSVYKGVGELRDAAQFESWLYRIAKNVYFNEMERRGAKKRTALQVSLEEQWAQPSERDPEIAWAGGGGGDPMEIVLEKERLKKLREAMQELPPQMQRAVYLRVVKELSVQEIAAVLNVSVNTVKSHLHQARRALKEKLSSVFGDVDL